MKRRFTVVAAITAMIAATLAMPAGAVQGAQGPACTHIVNQDGFYHYADAIGAGNAPYLTWTLTVEAKACPGVVYQLHVFDSTNGDPTSDQNGTLLATPTVIYSPFDTTTTTVTLPDTQLSSSVTSVCIYATTSIASHIADRSPNGPPNNSPFCVPVGADSGPGYSGWGN